MNGIFNNLQLKNKCFIIQKRKKMDQYLLHLCSSLKWYRLQKNFFNQSFALEGVAQLVGTSSKNQRLQRFNFWSGHTSRLQVQSPVYAQTRVTPNPDHTIPSLGINRRQLIDASLTSMFFSLFSLSESNDKKSFLKEDF